MFSVGTPSPLVLTRDIGATAIRLANGMSPTVTGSSRGWVKAMIGRLQGGRGEVGRVPPLMATKSSVQADSTTSRSTGVRHVIRADTDTRTPRAMSPDQWSFAQSCRPALCGCTGSVWLVHAQREVQID